ncbi:MAG TPA: phosphate ABC transporter permease PstC, partial [Rhodoblastus sp.]|nr:phosphate ABC transporter permease PstC [Rhodoblastus sp.]
MSEATLAAPTANSAGASNRNAVLSSLRASDRLFFWTTRLSAWIVLLILGGIIVSLFIGAWPAIRAFGLDFLLTQRWAPNAQPEPIMGGLGPIYGTLVSSLIAMAIALPVGIGVAVFLTELCPQKLRQPISTAIELLAGIPSIIYGMWGFFVLG